MSWHRSVVERIRAFVRGRSEDEDLDQELQFHLEMETEKLVRRGLAPVEARRQALIAFGGVDRFAEQARDERGIRALTDFVQDTRFALRQARRNPAFTLLTVLTIGLGVGGTVLGFAIADAVVLRPLPYPAPDRLVRIQEANPDGDPYSVSAANYLDMAAATRSLGHVVGLSIRRMVLLGAGEPTQARGMAVTPGYFRLLGIEPVVGRTFTEDDAPVAAEGQVAVLSFGLWQRIFGAEPDVVGRQIDVDGILRTVIGVAPPGPWPLMNEELWVPFGPDPTFPRGDHRLEALGQLADGASLADLEAELATLADDLGRAYPDTNAGWGFRVRTFPDWLISSDARRAVGVLAGAGALLLLLASASVSTLLLARATARQREVALRSALGARSIRVVSQLLVESLVLAAMGAVFGLLLVAALLPLVRGMGSVALPRLGELRLDLRTLAFAVAATTGAGVLFGLAPALHSVRGGFAQVLQSAVRVASPKGGRLRNALVASQIALAVVLLIGAGLLMTTFLRLGQVDPGFQAEGVLAVSISPRADRYPPQQREIGIFYGDILDHVRSVPGVVAAGAYNVSPFKGPRPSNRVGANGRATTLDDFVEIQWRAVMPGFFKALSIPLVRGRYLEDDDNSWDAFSASAQAGNQLPAPVVITSDLADRLWPGEDALDKLLDWNQPGGGGLQVVGIVKPIRDVDLSSEPRPMVFLPNGLVGMPELTLLVKARPGTPDVASALRRAVWEVDADTPVPEIAPLSESIQGERAGARLNAGLVGTLSLVALLLASLSLYGVVSFSTRQKTREIGIRVALGASSTGVVSPIVGQAMRLVLVGLAAGVAGAFVLSRVLSGALYGVEATNPRTYLLVVATLGAAALLASYLPARRAAKVDPAQALVSE